MTTPPESEPDRPWHAIGAGAVMRHLGTGTDGLLPDEIAARHARFGLNELPRPVPPSLLLVYLRQFMSPLVYLLLAATVVSALIGEWTDAGFIFAVLQINAIIGMVQEWKAEESARALDRLVASTATVIREGQRERIPGADLVPGDLVLIEPGMRVPADVRLIASFSMNADESLLTGESLPVEKDATQVLASETPLGDRVNMLFAGATVLRGEGRGVIVETGARTEVGRIAETLTLAGGVPPLVMRLKRFTNVITAVFGAVIVLISGVELLRGAAPLDIFITAVALAVAAVPEGLPVAITVALAIGTARMARQRVVVRLLPAVEGLGACTLIASDKTGTLTCNELTARRIWLADGTEVHVTGAGYDPEGSAMIGGHEAAGPARDELEALASAAMLCSEAELRHVDGRTTHYGDTLDVAFLVLGRKLGLDRGALMRATPRLDLLPFDAERLLAASFNFEGGHAIANVKGAAERVLPLCGGVDGAPVIAMEEHLARAGYRVLAVARGAVDADPETLVAEKVALKGLTFLGLVGFIDPLRPEARSAVRACAAAGVTVGMVTGDHPATALAIARELGMVAEDADVEGLVITGAELARLADDPRALALACGRARVFARVEPLQKLMIVQALQKSGHFVAVTGDGINDAPALRAANIGVAMGREGTDVARDAADLILTDDHFESIVAGMREGRIAYDNVRKVVFLLISTGAAEIVLFVLAIAAGLPLPLFPVQLLWLNLVTNGVQDVALAFEKGEPDVLQRPPRPPGQRIIDRVMATQVILSGAYMGITAFAFFWLALATGWSEAEARNALLLLMVLFENVQVFNARSETRSAFRVPFRANPFVVLSVIGAQALHIGAMYLPFGQKLLDVAPLAPETWLMVAAVAVTLLVVMESFKAWRRRSA